MPRVDAQFFFRHLLKNYCSLIKDNPNMRAYLCELIYAHTSHDINMRIKVVQSLKEHINDDEIVYSCHAFLIAQETEFNEDWFDVFLYYALIGLNSPRPYVRVYSLNILNSILKYNADGMVDVSEKILKLASDSHWEIRA